MKGDFGYLWVFLDFLGMSLLGTGGDWCRWWGLVWDQQSWKISLSEVFYDENLCLFQYSSMKRNKRIVANANVMIAFFILLHIVLISDVENVRKITNSRKISVLLNRLRNN